MGHPEAVEALLDAGSNLFAQNSNGKTALSLARENDKHDVVLFLESCLETPVNMTSLEYSTSEKELLLTFSISLVVLLGDALAGKTSFVRYLHFE